MFLPTTSACVFLEAWKPINASTNLHKHKSSFVSDQPDVISLSLNEELLIRVVIWFSNRNIVRKFVWLDVSNKLHVLHILFYVFFCLSLPGLSVGQQ